MGPGDHPLHPPCTGRPRSNSRGRKPTGVSPPIACGREQLPSKHEKIRRLLA